MRNKEGISRRDFLIGAGATLGSTGLATGAAFLIPKRDRDGSITSSNQNMCIAPNVQECSQEEGERINDVISRIKQRYPKLSDSFRDIALSPEYINDADVQTFLRRGTFNQFQREGLIRESDGPIRRKYLDPHAPGGMWEDKCQSAQHDDERYPNRVPQAEVCERIRTNTSPEYLPNEVMDARSLIQKTLFALNRALEGYRPRELTTMLCQSLTPEILLSISTHELMPSDEDRSEFLGGDIPIQPHVRQAMYRSMIDTGWQPNRVPAVHDSIASFGFFQMTQEVYENGFHTLQQTPDVRDRSGGSIGNLLRRFPELPSRFHDCVSVDAQLLAGALHQIENVYTWIARGVFQEYPIYQSWWGTLASNDKTTALASMLGGCHHRPVRARSAMRRIASVLTEQTSVSEFITLFTQDIRNEHTDDTAGETERAHPLTALHAERTPQLIQPWQSYRESF